MISSVITVKLKILLEERGKSIFQLHKETNITYPTLHKIASGKGEGISFKVLEKLCENLGCFPSDLLLFERNTTPQTAKPQTVKADPEKPASKPVKARTISGGVEGMLSTVEAAARLGVSRKSVNDYIVSGKLKAAKGKGNHNLVSEADYLEFESWYRQSKDKK
jgi:excisionase family DNA binding protein